MKEFQAYIGLSEPRQLGFGLFVTPSLHVMTTGEVERLGSTKAVFRLTAVPVQSLSFDSGEVFLEKVGGYRHLTVGISISYQDYKKIERQYHPYTNEFDKRHGEYESGIMYAVTKHDQWKKAIGIFKIDEKGYAQFLRPMTTIDAVQNYLQKEGVAL